MTQKRAILHFITPLKNVSPFDVNMATDSGFDVIVPYTDVDLKEVQPLVQDAIFSRAPEDGALTAVLIGGRDPLLAFDMFDRAKNSMVKPHFEISVMTDPSGAFTTAAGMVAITEKHLKPLNLTLEGLNVVVFGATGPVGSIAGLMAAQSGAKVTLVGYDGLQRVSARADAFGERFGVALSGADGSDESKKAALIDQADIILSAGPAGQQIVSAANLKTAAKLKVAVDVNAVPPAGVEGLDAFADGTPIPGTNGVGVGALAIGNIKFKTEHELLGKMRSGSERFYAGVAESLAAARRHAGV